MLVFCRGPRGVRSGAKAPKTGNEKLEEHLAAPEMSSKEDNAALGRHLNGDLAILSRQCITSDGTELQRLDFALALLFS